MKNWKTFIIFVCLLTLILVNPHRVYAQQNLAQQAYAIFERNCLNCHGEHGAFTEEIIIEHTALIETGAVVPGKPAIESELYKRLLTNDPAKRMPLGQPQLPPAAILTIGNWIQAGAPDWESTSETDGPFITPKEMLDTIEKHVNSLLPFDRAFTRYFTMTHLYNAGESVEALHTYQRALSKLVNSLSWGRTIKVPQPIDSEETIFYIDLRDYEWEVGSNRWTLIEAAYPYEIEFNAPTQTALREKLTNLREKMACEVPFVHVDWFIATAALPPLYHDILGLPETDRELETRLEVNVVENIRNAPGKRVWRAGFNDSGVSNNNRVVERHDSRYGAYWKSYDFAGSVGTQNIFTHPLSFTHDGGEIIFNLPNGLQAYYLADASGRRLDEAPINIVSNPAASDPTVRNGLSCIGCHTEGMKDFQDTVRAVIQRNANPPFNKDRALQLYTDKSTMDRLVREDTDRYRQALEATGGVFGGIEPVQRFHEAFQRPLDAAHAAAAVGLETEVFLEKIRENVSLQNLGLQVLENSTMKRDAWRSNFDQVLSVLNTPDGVLPPTEVRPERIPGTGVYISDPNLRAVIAETLGKEDTATVPITPQEMATLTTLRASNRDIKDLTGIEYAINLEELWISNNPISDLSPLAELKSLIEVGAWDAGISNLSPFSGLTKLRGLHLGSNPVSDLSPLASLTSLEILYLYGCGLEDLSQLAGLTGLKHLSIANNAKLSDVSPLAGLINLEWLDCHGCDSLSDLSPLAGLTKLEYLNLNHTRRVSDYSLSPLSGLTSLRRLRLAENRITDVSPLSGLTNLARLDLPRNEIVDISPLSSLTGLTELYLHENRISDVSSLAGLINLEWLDLRVNQIPDISSLDGLAARTYISWLNNPGAPIGGRKIEGPWLWVPIPEKQLDNNTDLLSEVSEGSVTEHQIATRGAAEGKAVGNYEWTSHKISPIGTYDGPVNNMWEMVRAFGLPEEYEWKTEVMIVYGSVILDSPREQKTRMFVGSAGRNKVWLNGKLIYEQLIRPAEYDYWSADSAGFNQYFPITLKPGANVLLVAVGNGGTITGHFGFEQGTDYTLIPFGVGFAFSATQTTLLADDMLTLNLNAEEVTNLAGWQADITFDPKVLEATEVVEGDFLMMEGGDTFFQGGTIDNTVGKIKGMFAARQSENGVSGTGTLLSVTFRTKAGGRTQVTLDNFEFGSITGDIIPSLPPNITITVGGYPAWDVNQDGRVSVLDLILVAQDLGASTPANLRIDVNQDGIINIQDLILVAQHLGETTTSAAPSAIAIDTLELLDPAMIQAWITQAQVEDDGSIAFREGIANLQRLLASLIPEETVLLANYPNPFNPETWIPYQLSEPADVTLRIYSVGGSLIRTLVLGQMPAGIYQSRSRAAYWDGRNAVGERVASGVYFYTLTAGDFTATRKMLIRK
ncbi:leucine-rich repeat domain-containing protein [Candidatus Poribacteria bacterium]|nr:leucine-rich repeat domain-containing protein [Candidatus Poribacteria bacterium]